MANDTRNMVKSFAPSDGSLNVPLDTKIEIVFEKAMDANSLNSKTIYIGYEDGKVPLMYEYESLNHVLTLTPKVKLKPETDYEIRILQRDRGPRTAFGGKSLIEYSKWFKTTIEKEEQVPEPEVPDEEQEVIEEPVEPEEPKTPDEDIFEPVINGLVLLNSFPEQGGIIDTKGQIVLEFSQEVDSENLKNKVYVQKKSLHPLLDGLGLEDKLTPILAEEKVGTTHLMLVTGLSETDEYELVIEQGLPGKDSSLEESVRISFRTPFEHMYAEVLDLKLVLGEFANSFTDSELMRLIYQQSKSIYELMLLREAEVEGWDSSIPYAATQYVLYRSAYQAMVGQVIASSSGIRDTVRLGDLSVSQSENSSREIVDLLELFKKEVDRWWDILNGRTDEEIAGKPNFIRTVDTATRGGQESPYPDFITRVPFNEIGGA